MLLDLVLGALGEPCGANGCIRDVRMEPSFKDGLVSHHPQHGRLQGAKQDASSVHGHVRVGIPRTRYIVVPHVHKRHPSPIQWIWLWERLGKRNFFPSIEVSLGRGFSSFPQLSAPLLNKLPLSRAPSSFLFFPSILISSILESKPWVTPNGRKVKGIEYIRFMECTYLG